jgi:hypothetical protein
VVQAADQLEVLAAGEVLVDRRELAGQPDDRAQCRRVADHVEPGHPGGPGVGREQGGEDPHDGGLARPVGPEQPQHGPGRGDQVDLVTALTGPNARRRPSVTIASLTQPPMIWRCHGY